MVLAILDLRHDSKVTSSNGKVSLYASTKRTTAQNQLRTFLKAQIAAR